MPEPKRSTAGKASPVTAGNVSRAADGEKENLWLGLLGALAFAAVGGTSWFLLSRLHLMAPIGGLVTALLAIKGYETAAKGRSWRGVLLSSIIAMLVMTAAWYLCFAFDLRDAYRYWYENGKVSAPYSLSQCLRYGYQQFADSEIAFAYLKEWVFGFLMGIVGCAAPVWQAWKAAHPKQNTGDTKETRNERSETE